MHTYFVLSVYTVQCVVRDRCVYGDNVTDLEDIRRSPEPWKSKDGDCFMPFEEVCRLTWATVAVWAMLLMCTVILLAKEVSRNKFLYKKKPTRIPVHMFFVFSDLSTHALPEAVLPELGELGAALHHSQCDPDKVRKVRFSPLNN